MEYASIVASLLFVVAAYFYVSMRDRSYINVLTPTAAFMIPTTYILELLHMSQFGPSNTLHAYVLFYACQAGFVVGLAFAYGTIRTPTFRLPLDPLSHTSRIPAYIIFAAGVAIYLPILIKFRAYLADPRFIYAQTRSGYGLSFFLSTMLSYVALILLLFSEHARRLELVAFALLCILFQWLHGSKGQILTVIFIIVMHRVYVRGKTASFSTFMGFSLFALLIGTALFLVLNAQLILGGGLSAIESYSDYARNGMLVIDSDTPPLFGRLTLEDQIYPRIPRLLFPDKPKDFGDFFLAAHFFPNAYAGGQGAPAFGNGTWLADFSAMALPVLIVMGLLQGMMLRTFISSLQHYRSPGQFILALYASNITVFPIGIGSTFLLPEYLAIAVVTNGLLSLHLRRRANN